MSSDSLTQSKSNQKTSNNEPEAIPWFHNDKFNQPAPKCEPPVEVRTMRMILQFYPDFHPNDKNQDLAIEIEWQKRFKRFRGFIPLSVIDGNMARVINKLFVESYWNMADNRASIWMKKREQEYSDLKKAK